MKLYSVALSERGYIACRGRIESPAEEIEQERRQRAKKKRPSKKRKKKGK